MSFQAPLRVSVRVDLDGGAAAGERRHRLSTALGLPAQLSLAGALPIAGVCKGRVSFALPVDDGELPIEADAELSFDPEAPGSGSSATLLELDDAQREALERYVKERLA